MGAARPVRVTNGEPRHTSHLTSMPHMCILPHMSMAQHTTAKESEIKPQPLWLSAKGAAKRLGIGEALMLEMLHAGLIPAAQSEGNERDGTRRQWRVPVAELESFAVDAEIGRAHVG